MAGLFSPSSAPLADGRVVTAQNQPRNGSLGYTDVGLQFSAPHANTYALVSFANITVEFGHNISPATGHGQLRHHRVVGQRRRGVRRIRRGRPER